jgi:hypothetical protein
MRRSLVLQGMKPRLALQRLQNFSVFCLLGCKALFTMAAQEREQYFPTLPFFSLNSMLHLGLEQFAVFMR